MKSTFMIALLLLAGAVPFAAADDSPAELEKAVAELRAELEALQARGSADDRLAEIERRLDLLAAELEKARTGGAAEPAAEKPVPGFAPAASKVYGVARGVSLGGYGEMAYQHFAGEAQDGTPAGRSDRLDFVRAIVYVGYKFTDKILFNSELEFEHATTGEGAEERGEVSLEFGYLDFKPWSGVGLRAGLLLVPVGFLNELHEAPVFHGVRRPDLERVIIPTTWRENGVGAYGEHGPVHWRAYAVAGLDSAGFEGGEGLREGRQGGSDSQAEDIAFTGRLDYTGIPGLLAGASFFTGNSGQGAGFGGRVTLADVHAQYERRGLQLRALGVWTRVGDAALIDAANGLTAEESVGERQGGWYLEAAYDLMTLQPAGRWSVTPFLRYERFDTQRRVPAGFERDPANERAVLTAGVGVKPVPNVVLKADYQRLGNEARSGVNQLNLGFGYLF
ncbi:MAG TPA: hypothetical protein VF310_01910 [Vicinamibacteria bacterium]